MRRANLFVILPAAAGVVFALWALLVPTAGVAGSFGAWLAFLGALAVTLGALAAPFLRGFLRRGLLALVGLGAALTAVAAWFLMQWAFALAMLAALVGLVLTAALRPAPDTA